MHALLLVAKRRDDHRRLRSGEQKERKYAKLRYVANTAFEDAESALVDAALTVGSLSDIFTQDLGCRLPRCAKFSGRRSIFRPARAVRFTPSAWPRKPAQGHICHMQEAVENTIETSSILRRIDTADPRWSRQGAYRLP